jgi:hypothetical protein
MKKPVVKVVIAAAAIAVVIIILPELKNKLWKKLQEKKYIKSRKFQTP